MPNASSERQLASVAEWTARASADNATTTATKAALAGARHYLTKVVAAFSVAPAANRLLQIVDGTTVLFEDYVTIGATRLELTFDRPLEFSRGNKIDVILVASGAGGNLGKVNIAGFTLENTR